MLDSPSVSPSSLTIASAVPIEVAPPTSPPQRPQPIPALSNEPEDFMCLDGSRLRVSYPSGREVVAVSLNGARPIAMHRDDEAGLTAYRAAGFVLRRSGVRVALVNAAQSVTVRGGDTLGSIALRTYGDRTRAADIARINALDNPDLIYPGQVLDLPQMEHRCRRTLVQQASYVYDATQPQPPRVLDRRLFSPPSDRQPDQRRVRATATDPR